MILEGDMHFEQPNISFVQSASKGDNYLEGPSGEMKGWNNEIIITLWIIIALSSRVIGFLMDHAK